MQSVHQVSESLGGVALKGKEGTSIGESTCLLLEGTDITSQRQCQIIILASLIVFSEQLVKPAAAHEKITAGKLIALCSSTLKLFVGIKHSLTILRRLGCRLQSAGQASYPRLLCRCVSGQIQLQSLNSQAQFAIREVSLLQRIELTLQLKG